LAFGPLLALAATLALAPEAAAAPKTCSLKPAACQLEQTRAERRAQAPVKAGDAAVLRVSKTAAADAQRRAAAKQEERGGSVAATAPACSLKSAACALQQRQSAR
jgi:hypothetical protein